MARLPASKVVSQITDAATASPADLVASSPPATGLLMTPAPLPPATAEPAAVPGNVKLSYRCIQNIVLDDFRIFKLGSILPDVFTPDMIQRLLNEGKIEVFNSADQAPSQAAEKSRSAYLAATNLLYSGSIIKKGEPIPSKATAEEIRRWLKEGLIVMNVNPGVLKAGPLGPTFQRAS